MFQHWGKQLEIRYLVSDRGQIFKIKMWGKGRKETEGGKENEYVVCMYVWCMYVYMYITSQSNNPMKNWIKCATFHLTEILILLVSAREQRNQHSAWHKQQELPFRECWATLMTLSTFLNWRLVLLLLVQTLRKGLHSIRLALLSKETNF